MIMLLTAFVIGVIFCGGGVYIFAPITGLLIGGVGAIGVFFIIAIAAYHGSPVHAEGLATLGLLRSIQLPDHTFVYISTNGHIDPATGMFECKFDGEKVLVIERNDNLL